MASSTPPSSAVAFAATAFPPVGDVVTQPKYDRAVLVDVLVYHYRRDSASCGCGWAELGRSHPEHVATVYEESIAVRADAGGSS